MLVYIELCTLGYMQYGVSVILLVPGSLLCALFDCYSTAACCAAKLDQLYI